LKWQDNYEQGAGEVAKVMVCFMVLSAHASGEVKVSQYSAKI